MATKYKIEPEILQIKSSCDEITKHDYFVLLNASMKLCNILNQLKSCTSKELRNELSLKRSELEDIIIFQGSKYYGSSVK